VDRRDLGSWLEGPTPESDPDAYPGRRLGRPETGPGAIARPGRRFLALLVDWLLCLLIARGLLGPDAFQKYGSLIPVGVLVLENWLLVGTAGATIGQRVVGVQVERLDGAKPGPGPALIRAVALGVLIPAITLLWNRDHRGLHEVWSGTVVAVR
jgi:uncharacterized RDD family membrane protein YckC